MKTTLLNILYNEPDRFLALCEFYHAKNTAGFGLFSCFAGESFPNGWIKAIVEGSWKEEGVYGDNFRKCFRLKVKKL